MYLFLELNECTNLPQFDLVSKSDVYCKIYFQNTSKCTDIKNNNNNPTFNSIYIFPYEEEGDKTVSIDIMDYDGYRSQLIKSVSFEIENNLITINEENISLRVGPVHILTDEDLSAVSLNAKRKALTDVIEHIKLIE